MSLKALCSKEIVQLLARKFTLEISDKFGFPIFWTQSAVMNRKVKHNLTCKTEKIGVVTMLKIYFFHRWKLPHLFTLIFMTSW